MMKINGILFNFLFKIIMYIYGTNKNDNLDMTRDDFFNFKHS